jgi:hypothetical protein
MKQSFQADGHLSRLCALHESKQPSKPSHVLTALLGSAAPPEKAGGLEAPPLDAATLASRNTSAELSQLLEDFTAEDLGELSLLSFLVLVAV